MCDVLPSTYSSNFLWKGLLNIKHVKAATSVIRNSFRWGQEQWGQEQWQSMKMDVTFMSTVWRWVNEITKRNRSWFIVNILNKMVINVHLVVNTALVLFRFFGFEFVFWVKEEEFCLITSPRTQGNEEITGNTCSWTDKDLQFYTTVAQPWGGPGQRWKVNGAVNLNNSIVKE